MKNIIIIGPQGSGKGTQAEKIIAEFKLIHIESGALIRSRAKIQDEKGRYIDEIANKKGQLLPDGLVLDLIEEKISQNPTDTGYLFDGYPRTISQYEVLTQLLKATP